MLKVKNVLDDAGNRNLTLNPRPLVSVKSPSCQDFLQSADAPPPLRGRDLQAPPAELGYAQARWTGKLLARHLSTRYQTELAIRTCQRLLKASRAKQASAP